MSIGTGHSWRVNPFMMVMGYSDDERQRRVRELSAAEFITKPVDFDQRKAQLRELPARRPEFSVPAFPAMRAATAGTMSQRGCLSTRAGRPQNTGAVSH